MPNLFDTETGIVTASDQVKFWSGMPLAEIDRQGLTIVRQFDLETGWQFRTTTAFILAGHTVFYALGFENAKLRRVKFSFTDMEDEVMQVSDVKLSLQKQAHDHFLLAQSGKPTQVTQASTRYLYSWGEITSAIDPRAGSAYLFVGLAPWGGGI